MDTNSLFLPENAPNVDFSGSGAASTMSPDPKIPRSCASCHKRKIRCDRGLPCANCSKTSNECYYPEPVPPQRRAQKANLTQLNGRLAHLEQMVRKLAKQKTSSAPPPLKTDKSDQDGRLLATSGSAAYVEDPIHTGLLDELDKMRSEFEELSVDTEAEAPPVPLNDVSLPSADELLILHPSESQALSLWQIYAQNFDPVVKILHVPTMSKTLAQAVKSLDLKDRPMVALLFAIYMAAVLTMQPLEVETLYGVDRSSLLLQYRLCTESAISSAFFLGRPDLRTLQALTIYLASRRACGNSKMPWTLGGAALRMGQTLGLHKKGTKFKISPFETEIRRRVWWHTLFLETRSSEDHGLQVSSLDPSWDAPWPINVNDSDLYPEMEALPEPRKEWTDMSISRMRFRFGEAYLKIFDIEAQDVGTVEEQFQAKMKLLDSAEIDIDKEYFSGGFEASDYRKLAHKINRYLMIKFRFIAQQQYRRRKRLSRSDTTMLLPLPELSQILVVNKTLDSAMFKPHFNWMSHLYVQWYVLAHIYDRVELEAGSEESRDALVVAEAYFFNVESSEFVSEYGLVWEMVKLLRKRALQKFQQITPTSLSDNTATTTTTTLTPIQLSPKNPNTYFPDETMQDFLAFDAEILEPFQVEMNIADWLRFEET